MTLQLQSVLPDLELVLCRREFWGSDAPRTLFIKVLNVELKKKHFILCWVPGGSDGKASLYNARDPVGSLGPEDPLEKEMAVYSSTIAWKIPWMEEPGRLQSMGSPRVRHDWATPLHIAD